MSDRDERLALKIAEIRCHSGGQTTQIIDEDDSARETQNDVQEALNSEEDNSTSVEISDEVCFEKVNGRGRNQMEHEGEEEINENSGLPGAFAVRGRAFGETPEWHSRDNSNSSQNNLSQNVEDTLLRSTDETSTRERIDPVAVVVDEDEWVEQVKRNILQDAAEADALPFEEKKHDRKIYIVLMLLLVAVVVIALSFGLTRDRSKNVPEISSFPSSIPTQVVSDSPSSTPTSSVRLFLEEISPESRNAFNNPESPQLSALKWLEKNHTNIYEYPEDRIAQRYALATLFFSTNGEEWADSKDWLSQEHECKWYFNEDSEEQQRIRCPLGDRLESLSLKSNLLYGSIPNEISLVKSLKSIDLSDNFLYGHVPTRLGSMAQLETFNLRSNILTGSLPLELSLLTKLKTLDFSANMITSNLHSEIGFLTKMTCLRLEENFLSGTIPSEVGLLSKLQELSLTNNIIERSIPTTIGSMTNLRNFEMNENNLSGNIPSEITSLNLLRTLSARKNRLKGTIPLSLWGMNTLEVLDLGSNILTGFFDSVKLDLENFVLRRLEHADLSSNQLKGSIPSEIGLLTSLTYVSFEKNSGISGTLPTELGMLSVLETMNFGLIDLNGTFPEEICLLKRLSTVDLSRKVSSVAGGLSGSIPSRIAKMTGLEVLKLQSNNIGGFIPSEIGELMNLKSLDLSHNDIGRTLPSEMGLLTWLEYLNLAKNFLVGSIPTEIGFCRNLNYFTVFQNGFRSSIPSELGQLTRLETLHLTLNSFSETVPNEIGMLTRLSALSLESNNLSGSIPKGLCRLKMQELAELLIDCSTLACECCGDICPLKIDSNPTEICPPGEVLMKVFVTTDLKPLETIWKVVDGTSSIVLQGGPYNESDIYKTLYSSKCISEETCVSFNIQDSAGDGLCCNYYEPGDLYHVTREGSVGYSLYLDDEKVASGGNFGYNETVQFGYCGSSAVPTVAPDQIEEQTQCTLCEDGSDPPFAGLIVPYFNQSCSSFAEWLVNKVTGPEECRSRQATYGMYCGCQNLNALASEDTCRLCGGSSIPDYPMKTLGNSPACIILEYAANVLDDCEQYTDIYASTCCATRCSSTDPCDDGYFCAINKANNNSVCESCGSYKTSLDAEFCKNLTDINARVACEQQCKPVACNNISQSLPFRLELITDSRPHESWWTLADNSTGIQYASGGPYERTNTWVVKELCVPRDSCMVFTMFDGFGDGLCCDGDVDGTYNLFFDGKELPTSRGNFTLSESTHFGSDCL